jgi:hypothetical protein
MRGQLVFVVGLSGAGKSEIRYSAMRAFAGPPDRWAKGQLPAIAVRATPSDRSFFNPKEFITRTYMELREPDLSWVRHRNDVISPDQVHLRADDRLKSPLWTNIRFNSTAHRIRMYVEQMALARHVRAFFVEEAASLTYTHMGKHPIDHMVSLMCLAEEIDATMVLFGVPKMAALWEGHAEVHRRARFVFVERYRVDNREDEKNFQRLVLTVASRYRFSKSDLIRKCMDLAYATSAGVYGELDAYFRRADDIRAVEEAPAINKEHLERAVSSERALETLHRDAALFDLLQEPARAAVIRKILQS